VQQVFQRSNAFDLEAHDVAAQLRLEAHADLAALDPRCLSLVRLTPMAACLGAIGTVVVEAGDRFTDDDGYIGASFRQTAGSVLADILGSNDKAETVLGLLGWG
jgi:hypothetical protein